MPIATERADSSAQASAQTAVRQQADPSKRAVLSAVETARADLRRQTRARTARGTAGQRADLRAVHIRVSRCQARADSSLPPARLPSRTVQSSCLLLAASIVPAQRQACQTRPSAFADCQRAVFARRFRGC